MERFDSDTNHKWHVAINQRNLGESKDWQGWMYDAKTLSDEVPRLALLFKLERTGELPKTHRQCSHSDPEPVSDNHLSCCLGVKCKECPFLLALEVAQVTPEQLDEIKAWSCAAHILTEKAKRPNQLDDSEGYILTVDDKMYWENVYKSLSYHEELKECSACGGTGYISGSTVCDMCDGTGSVVQVT